jgi:hypothetical protein
MDAFIADFQEAYSANNGYGIAELIKPEAPPNDPGRLYAFYRSANAMTIQHDLRSALIYHDTLHIPKDEAGVWIDVFTTYWSAVGDLLHVEETITRGRAEEADWLKAYQSWKTLATKIISGFRNKLPAWSAPLLQSTGKYLRQLAVRADESKKAAGDAGYTVGAGDDIASGGKNENLEDAIRIVNTMFSICAGDK